MYKRSFKATEDDTPQIIQGAVHSETGKLTLTFKLVELSFNCSSIRTYLNYRVLLNYDEEFPVDFN